MKAFQAMLCRMFGHDMSWRRVPVPPSGLSYALGYKDGDPRPMKLRGECARCGRVDYAIPPETANRLIRLFGGAR